MSFLVQLSSNNVFMLQYVFCHTTGDLPLLSRVKVSYHVSGGSFYRFMGVLKDFHAIKTIGIVIDGIP